MNDKYEGTIGSTITFNRHLGEIYDAFEKDYYPDIIKDTEYMHTLSGLYQGASIVYLPNQVAVPNRNYMKNTKVVLDRTPFNVIITDNIVSNVPVETTVFWPDFTKTVEMDGEIEVILNVSGTIILKLDHPQYLTTNIEVTYNV